MLQQDKIILQEFIFWSKRNKKITIKMMKLIKMIMKP